MNRLIKFRGYSDIFKTWLYGSYMELDNLVYICGEKDFEADGHHIKQISDEPLWVTKHNNIVKLLLPTQEMVNDENKDYTIRCLKATLNNK